MKGFLSLALLTCFTTSTVAQTETTPYKSGQNEGVVYFLPRTQIKVTVHTEKTEHHPGEFCQYAERYMHINNAPQTAYTTYKIKGIEATTVGVPDSTKAFVVKLRPNTSAPLMTLANNGVILGINKSVAQPELNIPAKTTSSNQLQPRQYYTADIMTAGSNAKMAELVAQEIFDLRDSRNDLTRGEADNTPKDGQQLNLMLQQLKQQEDALTQAFIGYETTTNEYITLTIDPNENIQQQVLFRFSQHLGITAPNDLSGNPFYYSFNIEQSENQTPLAKKKANGVYYNIPGKGKFQIFTSEQNYLTQSYAFGQFGCVDLLSGTLFNKRMNTKVTFTPSTGGIMTVEGE